MLSNDPQQDRRWKSWITKAQEKGRRVLVDYLKILLLASHLYALGLILFAIVWPDHLICPKLIAGVLQSLSLASAATIPFLPIRRTLPIDTAAGLVRTLSSIASLYHDRIAVIILLATVSTFGASFPAFGCQLTFDDSCTLQECAEDIVDIICTWTHPIRFTCLLKLAIISVVLMMYIGKAASAFIVYIFNKGYKMYKQRKMEQDGHMLRSFEKSPARTFNSTIRTCYLLFSQPLLPINPVP